MKKPFFSRVEYCRLFNQIFKTFHTKKPYDGCPPYWIYFSFRERGQKPLNYSSVQRSINTQVKVTVTVILLSTKQLFKTAVYTTDKQIAYLHDLFNIFMLFLSWFTRALKYAIAFH